MTDRQSGSICSVFETAVARHAERAAVLMDAETLNYGELGRRARQVAGLLTDLVPDNPRVALLADNGLNYVVLYWGILLAGKVSVELNPGLGDNELLAQMREADAGIYLAEQVHADRFQETSGGPTDWPLLVRRPAAATGDDRAIAEQLCEILEGRAQGGIPVDLPSPAPDALASIVYTSGTTGEVKGVCLTHDNLAWTLDAIACSLGLGPEGPNECLSGHLPLYYTYGKSILLLATYLGAPIVFTRRVISPRGLLGMVKEHQVTHLPLVPYLANLLLRSSGFSAQELPHLRLVTVAGGALSEETRGELCARFPTRMVPMYGLTEASTRVTCMPPGETAGHPASCGKPLPGVELDIVGDDGRSLSPGEVGEVLVRGPNVMSGYFRDPAASAGSLTGRWLHTGDLGFLDAEGYLTISGRCKEIIKVMGESVSATALESVIGRLAGVVEVAVRGIPDPTMGEAICAYIVIRGGHGLNADVIRRYCAGELGRVRVPTYVRFVSNLPKTASGKIRKHLLTLEED